MSAMTGFVITADSMLRTEFEHVLSQITAFTLIPQDTRNYPKAEQMGSLLEFHAPSVVFVDVADMPRALKIAADAGRQLPGVLLVAIARQFGSETMLTAMRAGMREFLTVPLKVEETREALSRLQRVLEHKPATSAQLGGVCCFLPAKPGVGTSTICLNTATALSALPEARVALLDFDLYNGTLDFMLNLNAGGSMRGAAEHAGRLDETIWNQMISRVGNLEVLRAGKPDPERLPIASRLAAVLRYARQHYTSVCIDLPGAADPGSIEALRASTQILLVTSTEIASIQMAERTIALLKEQHLDDRMSVVVNRMDARATMNRFQIEERLGAEVIATFPNYYDVLQRALSMGHAVIQHGVLGKRFADFACALNQPRKIEDHKPGIMAYINRIFN